MDGNKYSMMIIKEPWELDVMRTAGGKLAEVFHYVSSLMLPGISTEEIDKIAEDKIISLGAIPILKGYRVGEKEFPCATCISINEEVVHGIPSKRILQDSDLVSLDISLAYNGYHSDMAVTIAMPHADFALKNFIQNTEECLRVGILSARQSNRIGDIGHNIELAAKNLNLGIVTSFVGHGIGRSLHEEPPVPNFGKAGTGFLLKPGMVLAIEPMLSIGSSEIEILQDGWTAVTKDKSMSAHFEHTVAITAGGPRILTK
jgi:methionyl aminopeptidase